VIRTLEKKNSFDFAISRKNTLHIHEKLVYLAYITYLRYLVKVKHHFSYFYNALLEYCPLIRRGVKHTL